MSDSPRTPADQLPHLIRLLDDDTPVVRESVMRALLALGPDIESEIHRQQLVLTDDQRSVLQDILTKWNSKWVAAQWPAWNRLPESIAKLERGWSLINAFMDGPAACERLPAQLDELAAAYRAFDPAPGEPALADFLFRREGFSGARHDYDTPQNSNLIRVIEHRRGIPISLCSIYMLVAARLGLDVQGCNYPGHFLCRIMINKTPYVVDCFNGGRILDQDHAPGMTPEVSPSFRRMIRETPRPTAIIQRALRNLVRTYESAGRSREQAFMETLLKSTSP